MKVVAHFELAEALRSRRLWVVFLASGATSAFVAYALARALEQTQEALGSALPPLSGRLTVDDVTGQILRWAIDDPELASELANVDPLAVGYGVLCATFVALLALIAFGTAHARDLDLGATRFVLTRCDRLSWALGKLTGQAALLAFGLVVGAFVTALVGGAMGHLQVASLPWLARVTLANGVYGSSYMGIFCGVALWTRSASRARLVSVTLLFVTWPLHAWAVNAESPVRLLAWVFPRHHVMRLWSPDLGVAGAAAGAVLVVGALAFLLGYGSFRRGDA